MSMVFLFRADRKPQGGDGADSTGADAAAAAKNAGDRLKQAAGSDVLESIKKDAPDVATENSPVKRNPGGGF